MKKLQAFSVFVLLLISTQVFSVPQWSASTQYSSYDMVEYDSRFWVAKWWVQGQTPDTSTAWFEFQPNTVASWDASQAYGEYDSVLHNNAYWIAKWWVQGQAPGTSQAWQQLPLSPNGIVISNISEGDQVAHQLLLLRGSILSSTATSITATIGTQSRSWPVIGGKFKVTAELAEGVNQINLLANTGEQKTLNVTWNKKTGTHVVRLVYAVTSDTDYTFQAPVGEPNDLAAAKERMAFMGLLMQTATAELMRNAGYAPKTFALARDAMNNVIVDVLNIGLTTAQAHALTGHELYSHIAALQSSLPNVGNAKNVVYMQFSRYEAGVAKAHTALGGGSLALYGGLTLHTYASNLDELVSHFSDARDVNAYGMFPDTRNLFWQNYATGVGATLHELGHTFGLGFPHSSHPDGVMNRGFDRFNRIFMLDEAGYVFPQENIIWDATHSNMLDTSAWLN